MVRINKSYFLASLLFISSIAVPAYADMGIIVPAGVAEVSEQNQKAIVIHNGIEEIIILTNKVVATDPVVVLRFIPFPNSPQVTAAPPKCFKAVNMIIKARDVKYMEVASGASIKDKDADIARSFDIKFDKKVQASDVFVVKINSFLQFRNFVNKCLEKKGLPHKAEYKDMETIVSNYLSRGIRYFAFDFLELNRGTSIIEPLMYKFNTEKLYYPLEISDIFYGIGSINIVFLTGPDPDNASFEGDWKSTSAHMIDAEDAEEIYPNITEFFEKEPISMPRDYIHLEIKKYFGLFDFKNDIYSDIYRDSNQ